MAAYVYCLVEGTYVVRQRGAEQRAEYLTPEGGWLDYPDLWDVITNGRPLADEEAALATAREIFERNPEWWTWQGRARAGEAALQRSDHAAAERLWRACLEFEAQLGVTRSLDSLTRLYRAQGRLAEAEALSARALAVEENSLGPDGPALAERLQSHAALLREMERGAEAEEAAARAEALRRPASGPARRQPGLWARLRRWLAR